MYTVFLYLTACYSLTCQLFICSSTGISSTRVISVALMFGYSPSLFTFFVSFARKVGHPLLKLFILLFCFFMDLLLLCLLSMVWGNITFYVSFNNSIPSLLTSFGSPDTANTIFIYYFWRHKIFSSEKLCPKTNLRKYEIYLRMVWILV